VTLVWVGRGSCCNPASELGFSSRIPRSSHGHAADALNPADVDVRLQHGSTGRLSEVPRWTVRAAIRRVCSVSSGQTPWSSSRLIARRGACDRLRSACLRGPRGGAASVGFCERRAYLSGHLWLVARLLSGHIRLEVRGLCPDVVSWPSLRPGGGIARTSLTVDLSRHLHALDECFRTSAADDRRGIRCESSS
jgi:hypothetical protein